MGTKFCGCFVQSQEDEKNISNYVDETRFHQQSNPAQTPNCSTFEIGLCTDQDKHSKLIDKDEWISYLQHAIVTYNIKENTLIDIKFQLPSYIDQSNLNKNKIHNKTNSIKMKTKIHSNNRGAELSALCIFNFNNYQRIITGDDRTGIVYEITKEFDLHPISKLVEQHGDNGSLKCLIYNENEMKDNQLLYQRGMKIEWMTIKDEILYIGSNGIEWVDFDTHKIKPARTFVGKFNQKEMKLISSTNWLNNYNVMRNCVGAVFPGWIVIECVIWSNIHRKWFILPRYLSINAPFNHLLGNYGCNLLIIATENFDKCNYVHLELNKANDNNIEYVNSLYKNYDLINEPEIKNIKNDFDNAKNIGIITTNDVDKMELNKIQNDISKSLFYSSNGVIGFSDGQFIPGTNDNIIIATRSWEDNATKKLTSSICIFDINGKVYVEEYKLKGNRKYEGLAVF